MTYYVISYFTVILIHVVHMGYGQAPTAAPSKEPTLAPTKQPSDDPTPVRSDYIFYLVISLSTQC